MSYNFSYHRGFSMKGYGKDPALSTARSKVDKNISGLLDKVKGNDIIFTSFENAEEITIGDSERETIIDIRFATDKATFLIFQAEILGIVETSVNGITYDDATVKLYYISNGSEITTYHPTETYYDGKHIISLMYVIPVDTGIVNRWQVEMELDGGSITIQPQNVRATIYGQGLAASDEWDGFLDFSENVGEIAFTNISVDTISDNVIFDIQDPIWQSMTERVSEITFDNMILETISENLTAYITEHAYINADNIPLYYDTAVEYSEGAYRIIEDADTPQELIKQLIDVGELVDITSITVDGSNITLQFGDDGLSWYSYINSNWIETSTEMTVNQAAALTIDDWIKLTSTSLWIKVSLNVANSYLAELEIEYIEGVSEE